MAPNVCFYLLGRSVMSPSLGRVVFSSRCPLGPSGAGSLMNQATCSSNVSCVVFVSPLVVLEP